MKIFLLSGKGSGSEGKMRKGGFALAHRSLSHFCAPDGKFIEPDDGYFEEVEYTFNKTYSELELF